MEKNLKAALIGFCGAIIAAIITSIATISAPIISLKMSNHNQEEITSETDSSILHKKDADTYSVRAENTQSYSSQIVTSDFSASQMQTTKEIINLIATNWKNINAYQEFPCQDAKSFKMFGKEYFFGFTLLMGASYNMWGNGEQYVSFNVSGISAQYSFIDCLVGHVDEYSDDDIVLKIYLDKTIEMIPDYTYTIFPTLAPSRISIDVSGTSSMTILVINQGDCSNMIGFSEISFR